MPTWRRGCWWWPRSPRKGRHNQRASAGSKGTGVLMQEAENPAVRITSGTCLCRVAESCGLLRPGRERAMGGRMQVRGVMTLRQRMTVIAASLAVVIAAGASVVVSVSGDLHRRICLGAVQPEPGRHGRGRENRARGRFAAGQSGMDRPGPIRAGRQPRRVHKPAAAIQPGPLPDRARR